MDDLFCADGDEEACSAKPQTRLFTLAFTCDTVDTTESDGHIENGKDTDCGQVLKTSFPFLLARTISLPFHPFAEV